MTGEEMLAEMIQVANQAILEGYGVTLSTSNLSFTGLVSGEFDGKNTKVGATARGKQITGSYVYYYNRLDMQQAFIDIGEPIVSVEILGEITPASVVTALRIKYNFVLNLNDIKDYTNVNGVVTITVTNRSFVWLGTLVLNASNGVLTLASQFPNNVLNGLVAPGGEPMTDGGVYDQLIS